MNTLTEKEIFEIIGHEPQMSSAETPLRPDAFVKTDAQKKAVIEKHFQIIMEELGLDMTDDSLRGTPHRVAKMFVEEIFSGLDPKNKPKLSVFDNSYHYDKMLVEANITFNSTFEHHFLPIIGKAHIGYVSIGKVIVNWALGNGLKEILPSTEGKQCIGPIGSGEKAVPNYQFCGRK